MGVFIVLEYGDADCIVRGLSWCGGLGIWCTWGGMVGFSCRCVSNEPCCGSWRLLFVLSVGEYSMVWNGGYIGGGNMLKLACSA